MEKLLCSSYLTYTQKSPKTTNKKTQMANTTATPSIFVLENSTCTGSTLILLRGLIHLLSQRTGGCSECACVFGICPEEHHQKYGITHTTSGHTFCPGWENITILPHFPHHFTTYILHITAQICQHLVKCKTVNSPYERKTH